MRREKINGKVVTYCRLPECDNRNPTGRHSWCSEKCIRLGNFRMGVGVREQVLERDHGICADCGCDTEKLARVMRHANHSLSGNAFDFSVWSWRKPSVRDILLGLGFDVSISLWQADHIVPIAEGGARTIDNYQTLCVPCHKKDTAALAKRLADARRGQSSLLNR